MTVDYQSVSVTVLENMIQQIKDRVIEVDMVMYDILSNEYPIGDGLYIPLTKKLSITYRVFPKPKKLTHKEMYLKVFEDRWAWIIKNDANHYLYNENKMN